MKKILFILLIPLFIITITGCDSPAPTNWRIENWLKNNINDNYTVINVEKTQYADPKEYTIIMNLQSDKGFDFYAKAEYRYSESYSDACGHDNGYKSTYYTNYDEKIFEFLEVKINNITQKYPNTTKNGNEYIYLINSYEDLVDLNNFAYDYFKLFDSLNIKTTRIEPTIEFLIKQKYSKKIKSKELLENKDEHLKELQALYKLLVQNNTIEDNQIDKSSPIYINKIIFNNTHELEKDIYYLPKYDKYGTNFYNEYFFTFHDYAEDIVKDFLNGTYEKSEDGKIIKYTINNNNYIVEVDNNYKITKNSEEIKISYMNSPIYYPSIIYKYISIDDYANLLGCTYEIKNNTLYLYTEK